MLYKKSTAAWREIANQRYYFRSIWESNYARWLQYQKDHGLITDWQHEPKTFWFEDIKRGVRSYLPDFHIANCDDHWWVEVKGYYDSKSLTKIKRFRKYYPQEKLILIDNKWFTANSKKLKLVIPGWEIGENTLKKGLKNERDQYMQF